MYMLSLPSLLTSKKCASFSSRSLRLRGGRLYYYCRAAAQQQQVEKRRISTTEDRCDESSPSSPLISTHYQIVRHSQFFLTAGHAGSNKLSTAATVVSGLRSRGSMHLGTALHQNYTLLGKDSSPFNHDLSRDNNAFSHPYPIHSITTVSRAYSNYPPNHSKINGNQATNQNEDTKKNSGDVVNIVGDSSKDIKGDITKTLQKATVPQLYEKNVKKIIFTTSEDISSAANPSEPSIHNISYLPTSLQPYGRLARLDKPIGTMLLLHPCLWSTALSYAPLLLSTTTTTTAAAAATTSSPLLLLSFTNLCTKFALGSFLMRGAGCTINDMWDAKYDKQVKRTTSRPLASGELSYSQAWMFLGGQLLAGLGVLLSLPVQSDYLQDVFVWGVASLPLVGLYPLMKRYTNYPQLVLGLTFNWGALMGWVAVHGGSNVDWSVVGPLYGGGVCWTLIYDTLYAHQDKVDDAKLGLKSTALTFGEQGTKPILTALTAVTWGCWMLAGYNVGFGNAFDAPWYYGGVSAAAAHLLWQVHTADLNNVENLAYRFRSNNTVGWIVFASCVGGDLMMVYRINDGVGVV